MMKRLIITLLCSLCFVINANAEGESWRFGGTQPQGQWSIFSTPQESTEKKEPAKIEGPIIDMQNYAKGIEAAGGGRSIKVSPDLLDQAIKTFFTGEENQKNALKEYKKLLKDDGSISTVLLWNICRSGGLNVNKLDGKQKCKDFERTLSNGMLTQSVVTFEVCGKDKGKTGATEYCITDFKDVQVQLAQAIALAEEWGLVKHKDASLKCVSRHRKAGSQDFVRCVSKNKNVYYEFEFDDVKESWDASVDTGINKGVCLIHGGKLTLFNDCHIDDKQCENVGKTIKKFGHDTKTFISEPGCCTIWRANPKTEADLKSAYGINNFVFCRGIQIQNAPSAESAIKRYIVQAAKNSGETITENDINCDAGSGSYVGTGCAYNGFTDLGDDVKTCFVGDKQIDFVFDDINEAWDVYNKGGISGMNCIASNGVYDGTGCRLLGKESCDQLIDVLKRDCLDCTLPKWDGTTCLLPDSADATKIEKTVRIVTDTGIAAVGVALAFVPGGQGGTAVAFTIITATGSALIVTGATMRVWADVKMLTDIYPGFVKDVEACHEETCARKLLDAWAQKMHSYKENLVTAEAEAVSDLLDYLFGLIPDNSDFWIQFMGDPNVVDPITCQLKEKRQYWQKIRLAGNIIEAVGAFLQIGGHAAEKITTKIGTKTEKMLIGLGNGGNSRATYGRIYDLSHTEAALSGRWKQLTDAEIKAGTALQRDGELAKQVLQNINLTRDELIHGRAVVIDGKRFFQTGEKLIPAVHQVKIATGGKNITLLKLNFAKLANPAWGTLVEDALSTGYFESRKSGGYKVPYCIGIMHPELVKDPGECKDCYLEITEEDVNDSIGDDNVCDAKSGQEKLCCLAGTDVATWDGKKCTCRDLNRNWSNDQCVEKDKKDDVVIPIGDPKSPKPGTKEDDIKNNGGGSNGTTTPVYTPAPTPTTTNTSTGGAGNTNSSTTTTHNTATNNITINKPEKNKNVGLIAGLTAAGLVATGAVVGGVVAATSAKKSNDASAAAANAISENADMQEVMNTANGIVGNVNGKQISLVPMPTTSNTNAKLVDVDGFAVAVVKYDTYNLPYFIKNNRWTPLLGIGETGRWFNVYPNASTNIATIDKITSLLNQQLSPIVISRFVGKNASGVSLPVADKKAFDIINAEFPNGVVQNENMTAKDAKLYSDNYDLMKSKLK